METEATVLVHIHRHLHGMEISCYSLPRSFGIHYYFFQLFVVYFTFQ